MRRLENKKQVVPRYSRKTDANHIPRALMMVTGKCEHCAVQVLYETENFRVELTEKGRQWVLFNEYPLSKAKMEFSLWMRKQEGKEEA